MEPAGERRDDAFRARIRRRRDRRHEGSEHGDPQSVAVALSFLPDLADRLDPTGNRRCGPLRGGRWVVDGVGGSGFFEISHDWTLPDPTGRSEARALESSFQLRVGR
jgi:hypothetical protein